MHSATNSNTFLAHFNHIDTFFGIVLGIQEHMPFNEKVAAIAQGQYPISQFVRKYQYKLTYFSDLRNQLVHGYRLDEHHYLLASDYAVQQIRTLQETMLQPPAVGSLFTRDLPTCLLSSTSIEVVGQMQTHRVRYLPVYDDHQNFVAILSERMIARQTNVQQDSHVKDLLRDDTDEMYLFMKADTSTYEVEGVFGQQREQDKELVVIFLTLSGSPDEPITGYITAADLPKFTEEIIL